MKTSVPLQWHLPEGAKARLGKSWIFGNIAYSPDGARLAVVFLVYAFAIGEQLTLSLKIADGVD